MKKEIFKTEFGREFIETLCWRHIDAIYSTYVDHNMTGHVKLIDRPEGVEIEHIADEPSMDEYKIDLNMGNVKESHIDFLLDNAWVLPVEVRIIEKGSGFFDEYDPANCIKTGFLTHKTAFGHRIYFKYTKPDRSMTTTIKKKKKHDNKK